MFRQTVYWAKRGPQGGYRAFDKLSSAAASLADVCASLVTMRLWIPDAEDYLGRKAELIRGLLREFNERH